MDILIVIDLQEASFSKSDKYDQSGLIERINILSNHIRKNQGKVIFIQHDGTKEEGLVPFTRGWEILKDLVKTKDDLVVRKTTNDAFCRTELAEVIGTKPDTRLLIAGWATDFCIDTTVRSAVTKGYNVIAVSDCHTCSNRPHLKAKQVIEHHNWVWQHLIAIDQVVEVLTVEQLVNLEKIN